MKCPECEKQGLKSIVFEGPSWSTCVFSEPYYGENGIYHRPDHNKTSTNYRCSNGHLFEVECGAPKPCDFCGETTHATKNCPHAVDLKAAHEYQMTR
jgi:hypothetical protein